MSDASKFDAPFLSVAIISFNEERIIEKTLSAIHDLADEIIVVDSFSTDNTLEIVKRFKASIIQRKWEGYSKQKNFAISQCYGQWILALDADEVVIPALKSEILQIIKTPGSYAGFKIKRKLFIGDRWIKYGGYYPDYQLRLFKNNVGAKFNYREVHESLLLDGNVGYLNNPLEHYAYENLEEYRFVLEKYAMLASREVKNKSVYFPKLRAIWTFVFRYLFRFGFLEGYTGLKITKAYSSYVYKKYKTAEGLK